MKSYHVCFLSPCSLDCTCKTIVLMWASSPWGGAGGSLATAVVIVQDGNQVGRAENGSKSLWSVRNMLGWHSMSRMSLGPQHNTPKPRHKFKDTQEWGLHIEFQLEKFKRGTFTKLTVKAIISPCILRKVLVELEVLWRKKILQTFTKRVSLSGVSRERKWALQKFVTLTMMASPVTCRELL